MGKFKVERSARPLAAMLREAETEALSAALQTALRRIGRPAARHLARHADKWELAPIFLPLLREPELRTAKLLPVLKLFIGHESSAVRLEAARTIGLYVHDGTLDEYEAVLLEMLQRDADRDVRQVVAAWREKIRTRYGEEVMR